NPSGPVPVMPYKLGPLHPGDMAKVFIKHFSLDNITIDPEKQLYLSMIFDILGGYPRLYEYLLKIPEIVHALVSKNDLPKESAVDVIRDVIDKGKTQYREYKWINGILADTATTVTGSIVKNRDDYAIDMIHRIVTHGLSEYPISQ